MKYARIILTEVVERYAWVAYPDDWTPEQLRQVLDDNDEVRSELEYLSDDRHADWTHGAPELGNEPADHERDYLLELTDEESGTDDDDDDDTADFDDEE